MKTDQKLWKIIDSRTGERATIASFFTKGRAELQIQEWIERDKKGGRPDCHDLIPFLKAVQEEEPSGHGQT